MSFRPCRFVLARNFRSNCQPPLVLDYILCMFDVSDLGKMASRGGFSGRGGRGGRHASVSSTRGGRSHAGAQGSG